MEAQQVLGFLYSTVNTVKKLAQTIYNMIQWNLKGVKEYG